MFDQWRKDPGNFFAKHINKDTRFRGYGWKLLEDHPKGCCIQGFVTVKKEVVHAVCRELSQKGIFLSPTREFRQHLPLPPVDWCPRLPDEGEQGYAKRALSEAAVVGYRVVYGQGNNGFLGFARDKEEAE